MLQHVLQVQNKQSTISSEQKKLHVNLKQNKLKEPKVKFKHEGK